MGTVLERVRAWVIIEGGILLSGCFLMERIDEGVKCLGIRTTLI